MEDVITDSPIFIETENLHLILQGYSEVDAGSPAFYSIIVEKLLDRGLYKMDCVQAASVAKCLSKATNVQKGGFGFYRAMEKHLKTEMHQGRVNYEQLIEIMGDLLAHNIGSNEFQQELEKFAAANFNTINLQNFVDMVKALSLYDIKLEELDEAIFRTIEERAEDFTTNQLQLLLWSLSRKHLIHNQTQVQKYLVRDVEDLPPWKSRPLKIIASKIKDKSPVMRARGIAFAVEAIANLKIYDQQMFQRFETVILAKLDDFIPHYVVKILHSYFKTGYGSGDFYDQLIAKIVQGINMQIYPQIVDNLRHPQKDLLGSNEQLSKHA
mmetsp:Transcript_17974/g.30585  ORF Transcript_17974/g.30585 Transcript_17974/m.30585 type:complete len:325 (-) Transcript_17974:938-1912(-)